MIERNLFSSFSCIQGSLQDKTISLLNHVINHQHTQLYAETKKTSNQQIFYSYVLSLQSHPLWVTL